MPERSRLPVAATNVVIHGLELLFSSAHIGSGDSAISDLSSAHRFRFDMSQPVRLALLVCDTPVPTVVSTYGDYLDIFRTFLDTSLAFASDPKPSFILSGYDVVQGKFPTPEDLSYTDGILISGSGPSPWALSMNSTSQTWWYRCICLRSIALDRTTSRLCIKCHQTPSDD